MAGVPASGHLAGAVRGLQPKINIWTTGGGAEGAGDSMAPLRNLFTSLPPLVNPDLLHQVLAPRLSPLGGRAVPTERVPDVSCVRHGSMCVEHCISAA